MSTVQRIAGMPVLVLDNGARIILEAIDPTTGAQVAGVDIRGVAITYEPGTVAGDVKPPDVFLAHLPTSV
jgi:hypothetical protein